MGSARGWAFERRHGSAAALCEPWPAPEHRTARILAACRVGGPALVLGSTQPPETADMAAASRLGVEVVRRRAGGGALFVAPDEQVWIDVWLPRADPLWDDDVVRSARWLGETWARALESLGAPPLRVHTGRSVETAWSRLVCFGGVGPGEVTVEGAKVVGIAQRRVREGARLLTTAHVRWDPAPLVGLLRLDPGRAALAVRQLASSASGLDDLVGRGWREGRGRRLEKVERAVADALP